MNRKGYGWIVIIGVLSAGLGQSAIAENIQTTKAEHPKLKGLLEEAVQQGITYDAKNSCSDPNGKEKGTIIIVADIG